MRSKSDAGTHRHPPIADNLRSILATTGTPGPTTRGKVVDRSVMSGKIALRDEAAWTATGLMESMGHATCRCSTAT
jgi:hypothetical protein